MTIRVCPERDGACPHGLSCPHAIDRYHCDMAASRTALAQSPSPIVDEVAAIAAKYVAMSDAAMGNLAGGLQASGHPVENVLPGSLAREFCSDVRRLAASLVSPPKAGTGEPVAWRYRDAWGRWAYCEAVDNVNGPTVITEKQPLYAAPNHEARGDGVRVTDEDITAGTYAACCANQDFDLALPKARQREVIEAALLMFATRLNNSALAYHAPALGETQPGLGSTAETRAAVIEECAKALDARAAGAERAMSAYGRHEDGYKTNVTRNCILQEAATAIRALSNPGDRQ